MWGSRCIYPLSLYLSLPQKHAVMSSFHYSCTCRQMSHFLLGILGSFGSGSMQVPTHPPLLFLVSSSFVLYFSSNVSRGIDEEILRLLFSLSNHRPSLHSLLWVSALGLGVGPTFRAAVSSMCWWEWWKVWIQRSSHVFRSYLPAFVGVHHSHSHGPVTPVTLSLLLPLLYPCLLLFTSFPSSLLLLPIRTNQLCKVRSQHTSLLLHVYL